LGAAAYAVDQIAPSMEVPADFHDFWNQKIAEMHAIGMNPVLTLVDIGDDQIDYYQVTMDNIKGSKIYGQLAKPKGKSNLPAMLQVQWAGVYPLETDWVRWQARNGWLAMNISAHDLPIDRPLEFYQQQSQGPLKDYPGIGADDQDKSYFLRMFLSCYRSVDFLVEHKDWNGKALVVHGGSQGGYQAIVTGGMHRSVTAVAANVPCWMRSYGQRRTSFFGVASMVV